MVRRLFVAVVVALLASSCGGRGGPTSPATSAADAPAAKASMRLEASLAANVLPLAMSRPAVSANGGTVRLLGGLTTGDVSTNAVVGFDAQAKTTRSLGTLASAVHDAGGAGSGNDSFVFAGGGASIDDRVQRWNGSGSVVGRLPHKRADLVAARVGDRYFVMGGTDGRQLATDVLATTDGVTFTKVGTLAQPVRYPALAVVGSTVYLFGGETQPQEGGTVKRTDVVQTFDTATGASASVGHLSAPLSHAMAFVHDDAVFLAGGRTETGVSSQVKRFDPASQTLTDEAPLPVAISDCGVATVGGKTYFLGGEIKGPADPQRSVITVGFSS